MAEDWARWSEDKLAKVKEMLDDGAPHREIAKTLGVSKNTILKYFPGSAWTHEQVVEHANLFRVKV